jgi:hypothetical protein
MSTLDETARTHVEAIRQKYPQYPWVPVCSDCYEKIFPDQYFPNVQDHEACGICDDTRFVTWVPWHVVDYYKSIGTI